MPLTGQAKVDYQREYMRRRRSVRPHPGMLRPSRVFKTPVRPDPVQLDPVRPDPVQLDPVRPTMQDNVTERMYKHNAKNNGCVKPNLAPDGFPIQHTNSMMVGYVPK